MRLGGVGEWDGFVNDGDGDAVCQRCTQRPDPRLQEAIAAAAAANVLVVCSAGNSGRDIDQVPSFPVSVPSPNLIGVAATAPAEGRSLAGFSNFGRVTVSLAAPGERVLIVDDVLATGGTAAATGRLVERLGGVVAGFSFLISLGFLDGAAKIDGYPIHSLITYD